jgi:hypothetical protein
MPPNEDHFGLEAARAEDKVAPENDGAVRIIRFGERLSARIRIQDGTWIEIPVDELSEVRLSSVSRK